MGIGCIFDFWWSAKEDGGVPQGGTTFAGPYLGTEKWWKHDVCTVAFRVLECTFGEKTKGIGAVLEKLVEIAIFMGINIGIHCHVYQLSHKNHFWNYWKSKETYIHV